MALLFLIISEGHPPFGDNPYRLFSPTTLLILVNVGIFTMSLITSHSNVIKLFPSMLLYTNRGKQTRIDFSRVTKVIMTETKTLNFFINDPSGKEVSYLKIKGYQSYKDSDEFIMLLKYILGERIKAGSILQNVGKKGSIFNFGSKD